VKRDITYGGTLLLSYKEGVCEKCDFSEGRENCLNSRAGLNWFGQKGHRKQTTQ